MAAVMEFITPTRKRIRRFKLDKGFVDMRGRKHLFSSHEAWGTIALRNFPDSWRRTDHPLYLVNPDCITPADVLSMTFRKDPNKKLKTEHVHVEWKFTDPNLTPAILNSLADGQIFKALMEAAKEKFAGKLGMGSIKYIMLGIGAIAVVLIGLSMLGVI
jgi:hypothetical protein